MTSAAYWKTIEHHAGHSTLQTLDPGQGYEDLQGFLIRPPLAPRSSDQYHQAVLSSANSYTIDNEIKPDISSHNDSPELLSRMESNLEDSESQIVFLKGFPSSEWLLGVGALCEIDPEFFRLHLQFRDKKECHTSPSLPSSLERIIRLRICTVGSREDKKGTSDQYRIEKLRREASEAKRLYEHDLGRAHGFKRGDSIVRAYHVLDEKHFLLEQAISVCVSPHAGSWSSKYSHSRIPDEITDISVLILTDVGNELSRGPVGPRLTKHDRQSSTP